METEQFINEIWKPIKENPVYLVSNYGRVKTIDHPVWCKKNNSYSIRKGIICKMSNNNSKKYWRVCVQINNKQHVLAVHRLVAQAFISNPNNLPQVNHIDGDKNNNCASNLEWCDNDYNMKHAIANNLIHTKEERKNKSNNCWMRKLNEEQVLFIRECYKNVNTNVYGEKQRFYKIMKELFGLKSTNTINWIANNGTNIFINQDIVQTPNFDKYKNQFDLLCQKYKARPKPLKDYAKELNVNYLTFKSYYIKHGIEETIRFYTNQKQRKL